MANPWDAPSAPQKNPWDAAPAVKNPWDVASTQPVVKDPLQMGTGTFSRPDLIPEKEFFDLGDTISGIWDMVRGIGATAPSAFYGLTEGLLDDGELDYSPSAKAAFKKADDFAKEMQAKSELKLLEGTGSSVGESFREAAMSSGFTIGSMAAAIPAALGGFVAGAKGGAALGLGSFAPAGPGVAGAAATIGGISTGTIGAVTSGMAASGVAAYRMAGASFLNESLQMFEAESMKTTGRRMTESERKEAIEVLMPIAKNTALWEAGPEAVGNAFMLGAGKLILSKPIKEAFTKAALNLGAKTATKAGAATAATKLTAGQVAKKAGALVGAAIGEISTEAMTAVEQNADQLKAQALSQGLDPNEFKPDWSMSGYAEAWKQVAPQTLALMTFMGGATKTAEFGINRLRKAGLNATAEAVKQRGIDLSTTNLPFTPLNTGGAPSEAAADVINLKTSVAGEAVSVLFGKNKSSDTLTEIFGEASKTKEWSDQYRPEDFSLRENPANPDQDVLFLDTGGLGAPRPTPRVWDRKTQEWQEADEATLKAFPGQTFVRVKTLQREKKVDDDASNEATKNPNAAPTASTGTQEQPNAQPAAGLPDGNGEAETQTEAAMMEASEYQAARVANSKLPSMEEVVTKAFAEGRPVSVSMVDKAGGFMEDGSGIQTPAGYTRQGNMMVPPSVDINGSAPDAQQAPSSLTDAPQGSLIQRAPKASILAALEGENQSSETVNAIKKYKKEDGSIDLDLLLSDALRGKNDAVAALRLVSGNDAAQGELRDLATAYIAENPNMEKAAKKVVDLAGKGPTQTLATSSTSGAPVAPLDPTDEAGVLRFEKSQWDIAVDRKADSKAPVQKIDGQNLRLGQLLIITKPDDTEVQEAYVVVGEKSSKSGQISHTLKRVDPKNVNEGSSYLDALGMYQPDSMTVGAVTSLMEAVLAIKGSKQPTRAALLKAIQGVVTAHYKRMVGETTAASTLVFDSSISDPAHFNPQTNMVVVNDEKMADFLIAATDRVKESDKASLMFAADDFSRYLAWVMVEEGGHLFANSTNEMAQAVNQMVWDVYKAAENSPVAAKHLAAAMRWTNSAFNGMTDAQLVEQFGKSSPEQIKVYGHEMIVRLYSQLKLGATVADVRAQMDRWVKAVSGGDQGLMKRLIELANRYFEHIRNFLAGQKELAGLPPSSARALNLLDQVMADGGFKLPDMTRAQEGAINTLSSRLNTVRSLGKNQVELAKSQKILREEVKRIRIIEGDGYNPITLGPDGRIIITYEAEGEYGEALQPLIDEINSSVRADVAVKLASAAADLATVLNNLNQGPATILARNQFTGMESIAANPIGIIRNAARSVEQAAGSAADFLSFVDSAMLSLKSEPIGMETYSELSQKLDDQSRALFALKPFITKLDDASNAIRSHLGLPAGAEIPAMPSTENMDEATRERIEVLYENHRSAIVELTQAREEARREKDLDGKPSASAKILDNTMSEMERLYNANVERKLRNLRAYDQIRNASDLVRRFAAFPEETRAALGRASVDALGNQRFDPFAVTRALESAGQLIDATKRLAGFRQEFEWYVMGGFPPASARLYSNSYGESWRGVSAPTKVAFAPFSTPALMLGLNGAGFEVGTTDANRVLIRPESVSEGSFEVPMEVGSITMSWSASESLSGVETKWIEYKGQRAQIADESQYFPVIETLVKEVVDGSTAASIAFGAPPRSFITDANGNAVDHQDIKEMRSNNARVMADRLSRALHEGQWMGPLPVDPEVASTGGFALRINEDSAIARDITVPKEVIEVPSIVNLFESQGQGVEKVVAQIRSSAFSELLLAAIKFGNDQTQAASSSGTAAVMSQNGTMTPAGLAWQSVMPKLTEILILTKDLKIATGPKQLSSVSDMLIESLSEDKRSILIEAYNNLPRRVEFSRAIGNQRNEVIGYPPKLSSYFFDLFHGEKMANEVFQESMRIGRALRADDAVDTASGHPLSPNAISDSIFNIGLKRMTSGFDQSGMFKTGLKFSTPQEFMDQYNALLSNRPEKQFVGEVAESNRATTNDIVGASNSLTLVDQGRDQNMEGAIGADDLLAGRGGTIDMMDAAGMAEREQEKWLDRMGAWRNQALMAMLGGDHNLVSRFIHSPQFLMDDGTFRLDAIDSYIMAKLEELHVYEQARGLVRNIRPESVRRSAPAEAIDDSLSELAQRNPEHDATIKSVLQSGGVFEPVTMIDRALGPADAAPFQQSTLDALTAIASMIGGNTIITGKVDRALMNDQAATPGLIDKFDDAGVEFESTTDQKTKKVKIRKSLKKLQSSESDRDASAAFGRRIPSVVFVPDASSPAIIFPYGRNVDVSNQDAKVAISGMLTWLHQNAGLDIAENVRPMVMAFTDSIATKEDMIEGIRAQYMAQMKEKKVETSEVSLAMVEGLVREWSGVMDSRIATLVGKIEDDLAAPFFRPVDGSPSAIAEKQRMAEQLTNDQAIAFFASILTNPNAKHAMILAARTRLEGNPPTAEKLARRGDVIALNSLPGILEDIILDELSIESNVTDGNGNIISGDDPEYAARVRDKSYSVVLELMGVDKGQEGSDSAMSPMRQIQAEWVGNAIHGILDAVEEAGKNAQPSVESTQGPLRFGIVGYKYEGREAAYSALSKGDSVRLVRQPENAFDSNAIAIFNASEEQLGFMPANLAAAMAPQLDAAGGTADAVVAGENRTIEWIPQRQQGDSFRLMPEPVDRALTPFEARQLLAVLPQGLIGRELVKSGARLSHWEGVAETPISVDELMRLTGEQAQNLIESGIQLNRNLESNSSAFNHGYYSFSDPFSYSNTENRWHRNRVKKGMVSTAELLVLGESVGSIKTMNQNSENEYQFVELESSFENLKRAALNQNQLAHVPDPDWVLGVSPGSTAPLIDELTLAKREFDREVQAHTAFIDGLGIDIANKVQIGKQLKQLQDQLRSIEPAIDSIRSVDELKQLLGALPIKLDGSSIFDANPLIDFHFAEKEELVNRLAKSIISDFIDPAITFRDDISSPRSLLISEEDYEASIWAQTDRSLRGISTREFDLDLEADFMEQAQRAFAFSGNSLENAFEASRMSKPDLQKELDEARERHEALIAEAKSKWEDASRTNIKLRRERDEWRNSDPATRSEIAPNGATVDHLQREVDLLNEMRRLMAERDNDTFLTKVKLSAASRRVESTQPVRSSIQQDFFKKAEAVLFRLQNIEDAFSTLPKIIEDQEAQITLVRDLAGTTEEGNLEVSRLQGIVDDAKMSLEKAKRRYRAEVKSVMRFANGHVPNMITEEMFSFRKGVNPVVTIQRFRQTLEAVQTKRGLFDMAYSGMARTAARNAFKFNINDVGSMSLDGLDSASVRVDLSDEAVTEIKQALFQGGQTKDVLSRLNDVIRRRVFSMEDAARAAYTQIWKDVELALSKPDVINAGFIPDLDGMLKDTQGNDRLDRITQMRLVRRAATEILSSKEVLTDSQARSLVSSKVAEEVRWSSRKDNVYGFRHERVSSLRLIGTPDEVAVAHRWLQKRGTRWSLEYMALKEDARILTGSEAANDRSLRADERMALSAEAMSAATGRRWMVVDDMIMPILDSEMEARALLEQRKAEAEQRAIHLGYKSIAHFVADASDSAKRRERFQKEKRKASAKSDDSISPKAPSSNQLLLNSMISTFRDAGFVGGINEVRNVASTQLDPNQSGYQEAKSRKDQALSLLKRANDIASDSGAISLERLEKSVAREGADFESGNFEVPDIFAQIFNDPAIHIPLATASGPMAGPRREADALMALIDNAFRIPGAEHSRMRAKEIARFSRPDLDPNAYIKADIRQRLVIMITAHNEGVLVDKGAMPESDAHNSNFKAQSLHVQIGQVLKEIQSNPIGFDYGLINDVSNDVIGYLNAESGLQALSDGFLSGNVFSSELRKLLMNHDPAVRKLFAKTVESRNTANATLGLIDYGATGMVGRNAFERQRQTYADILNGLQKKMDPKNAYEQGAFGYMHSAIVGAFSGSGRPEEIAERILTGFDQAAEGYANALAAGMPQPVAGYTAADLLKAPLNLIQSLQRTLTDPAFRILEQQKVFEKIVETFSPILTQLMDGQIGFDAALESFRDSIPAESLEFSKEVSSIMENLKTAYIVQARFAGVDSDGIKKMEAKGEVAFNWRVFNRDASVIDDGMTLEDQLAFEGAPFMVGVTREQKRGEIHMLNVNGFEAIKGQIDDMLYRINIQPSYAAFKASAGSTELVEGKLRPVSFGWMERIADERLTQKQIGDLEYRKGIEASRTIAFLGRDIIVKDKQQIAPKNIAMDFVQKVQMVGAGKALISFSQTYRQTIPGALFYTLIHGGRANYSYPIWLAKYGYSKIAGKLLGVFGNDAAKFSRDLDAHVQHLSSKVFMRDLDAQQNFLADARRLRPTADMRPDGRIVGRARPVTDLVTTPIKTVGRVIARTTEVSLRWLISKPESFIVRSIWAFEMTKAYNEKFGTTLTPEQLVDPSMPYHLEFDPSMLGRAERAITDIVAVTDPAKKAKIFTQSKSNMMELIRGMFVMFSNHPIHMSGNADAAWSMIRHGDKASREEGWRVFGTSIGQNVFFQLFRYETIALTAVGFGALLFDWDEDEQDDFYGKLHGIDPELGEEGRRSRIMHWASLLAGASNPIGWNPRQGAWTEAEQQKDYKAFALRVAKEGIIHIPGFGLLASTALGSSATEFALKNSVMQLIPGDLGHYERAGFVVPERWGGSGKGPKSESAIERGVYSTSKMFLNDISDRSTLMGGLSSFVDPMIQMSNASNEPSGLDVALLWMSQIPAIPREIRRDMQQSFQSDAGSKIWARSWEAR